MDVEYNKNKGIELKLLREEVIKLHDWREIGSLNDIVGDSSTELHPTTKEKYKLFRAFCSKPRTFFYLMFQEDVSSGADKIEKIADDCGKIFYIQQWKNQEEAPNYINLSRKGEEFLKKESYLSKNYGDDSRILTISMPKLNQELREEFFLDTLTEDYRNFLLSHYKNIEDIFKNQKDPLEYIHKKIKELEKTKCKE